MFWQVYGLIISCWCTCSFYCFNHFSQQYLFQWFHARLLFVFDNSKSCFGIEDVVFKSFQPTFCWCYVEQMRNQSMTFKDDVSYSKLPNIYPLNSNCETMKNHACLDTAWYKNSRLLVWYVRKVFMMRGLLMRKNVASNAWQISFNSYSKSASNVINHDTRPLRITFFSELNWEGKRVGSVARRFLAWRMSLCVSLHNGS